MSSKLDPICVIFGITDPVLPVVLTGFPLTSSSNDITIRYPIVCISTDSGLNLVNISDPSSASVTAHFATLGKTRESFISDDYIYVADGDSGKLLIIDYSVSVPSILLLTILILVGLFSLCLLKYRGALQDE